MGSGIEMAQPPWPSMLLNTDLRSSTTRRGERLRAPAGRSPPARPAHCPRCGRCPRCSRATAATSDRPSPEPGSVRLFSSRTKRSTHALAVLLGNARTVVGDFDQDAPTGAAQATPSILPCPSPSGLAYFSAFSTRLTSACPISSRLPCSWTPSAIVGLERHALLFGHRAVEFGHVARRRRSRSTSRSAPDGAPASARAIISSALKVWISLSLSAIVVSSASLLRLASLRRRAAPPRPGCAAGSAASSGRARRCR